jgi:hypothetical protein
MSPRQSGARVIAMHNIYRYIAEIGVYTTASPPRHNKTYIYILCTVVYTYRVRRGSLGSALIRANNNVIKI